MLVAWAVGMGLLTWRELEASPWRPPPPGRYLAASGLYALLGLVATSQAAAPVAATIAWGFNLALFLQVLPAAAGGPTTGQKTTQQPAAEGVQAA